MTPRRVALALVLAVLPSVAWADAWDEEMRAEHAAASSTNTAPPAGVERVEPPLSQLPICQPVIDRCPTFTRSVSAEPLRTALGLEGPSELQLVVEQRWQAQAVPRRTGAPRVWTPQKARKARR